MLPGQLVYHPDHPDTTLVLINMIGAPRGYAGEPKPPTEYVMVEHGLDPAPRFYSKTQPTPLPPCPVCTPRFPLPQILGRTATGELGWIDGGTRQPYGMPCTEAHAPVGHPERLALAAAERVKADCDEAADR